MTLWTALAASLCAAAPPPADGPTPAEVRAAVEKGLGPVVKSAVEYPKVRDCFSCHHQATAVLALTAARGRGFGFDDEAILGSADLAEADLRGALAAYKKGEGQPGGVARAGYALLTLELAGRPGDDVTESVARYLLARDESAGRWRTSSDRPPSEASDFTSTYLALRGLDAFGKELPRERLEARREKARRWLEAEPPTDTEDRVFRLLALKQAGADAAAVRRAADDLLGTQRPDGGWGQLAGAAPDAYATGSALFALLEAGRLKADDREYRTGLRFLIRSQRDDGTWFVKSRSHPFQPYFESGFPYGKDQFISMAASSWALAALVPALPPKPAPPGPIP